MDFSVLTPEFRQQLEQQLDRLVSERDAIVQTAVEQATRTIDANLSHINALLGKTDNRSNGLSIAVEGEHPIAKKSSTKTKTKLSRAFVSEPEEEEDDDEDEEESPKASKRKLKDKSFVSPSSVFNALKVSKASKTSKVKTPKPKLDDPELTPDFQGLKLADAIPAVFRQDPDRQFLIDDVIEVLYGPLDDAILPKTRQRVAVSLGHSSRRQEVRKVQDFPSIYCLGVQDEE